MIARGWRWARALAVSGVVALFGGPLAAQGAPVQEAPPEPGSELTVSVITMGPGGEIWERFGHNALWVVDHARGTSVAYNYGIFDFRQKNFVLRFLQGRMWYSMRAFDAEPMIEAYIRGDRSVWVQELDLPPRVRADLRDFLAWNDLPEHRGYHYDYYRDNCSTRVRDALDRALQGLIRATTDTVPTSHSYRWHTRRLLADDAVSAAGLFFILGEPVDRPITAHEEMFLPVRMQERLRAITLPGPQGQRVPLVKSERTLHVSTSFVERETPPNWLGYFLVAGLLLGGALFALGGRRGFVTLATTLAAVIGIVGTIEIGMWALTDHAFTYANENVLQANLLSLFLAIVIPAAVRGRAWARRPAVGAAVAVALLSLVGMLLKALPGFTQDNWNVIALLAPIHAGVLFGLLRATLKTC